MKQQHKITHGSGFFIVASLSSPFLFGILLPLSLSIVFTITNVPVHSISACCPTQMIFFILALHKQLYENQRCG